VFQCESSLIFESNPGSNLMIKEVIMPPTIPTTRVHRDPKACEKG